MRERVPNLLRLCVFVAVLSAGLSAFAYVRVRARLDDELLDLGAQMMRHGSALYEDTPRGLLLNGQPFELASGTVAGSVRDVLDRYAARCENASEPLVQELERIFPRTPEEVREPGALSHPIVPVAWSELGDDEGYVACVDLRTRTGGFVERVMRLGDSSLLSDVGGFRYVYAHAVGERTHFLALWSGGRLDLGQMFPPEGDAAGADVPGVPRPRGSRRALSAFERESGLGVVVYEAGVDDLADAERAYRGALGAGAGRGTLLAATGGATDGPRSLVFERVSDVVTIVLGASGRHTGGDSGGLHAVVLVSP